MRLLRYQDNQLREAVLEAIRRGKRPSETLMSEVLRIVTGERLYNELRVLAAEAPASLIAAPRSSTDGRLRDVEQRALKRMCALPDSPHPLVSHQAIRCILATTM